MTTDVFLSVGRPTTPEQERFVLQIERCLADEHDLRPRTLGRNEWSSEQPLRAIKKRMGSCSGAVIVAFQRLSAPAAEDWGREGEDRRIEPLFLTTIWNQIEASMAYTLGLPILILAEDGLRSEGLLEARYDWIVEWLSIEPAALNEPRCRGIISDWAERVREGAEAGRDASSAVGVDARVKPIEEKSIGELLSELKPAHARAAVAGTIASLAALASGAFALGIRAAGG